MSEELFASHPRRVSGFPEKGADLWRGPGNFWEVRELPGNLWIALKVRSERGGGNSGSDRVPLSIGLRSVQRCPESVSQVS